MLDGANHLVTGLSWGPNGLLAETDFTGSSPKTYQVIEDGTGSVVELVDPTDGAVAASYTYATYGAPLTATGPAVNVTPIRWAGLMFDGVGLPYGGVHRYYSPVLGRWISRDPTAEAGGLDTGEYADDDPVNESDPTGLAANWVTEVDYGKANGANASFAAVVTAMNETQARRDVEFNVLQGQQSSNPALDQQALVYYDQQLALWKARLATMTNDNWGAGKYGVETWNNIIDPIKQHHKSSD